MKYTTPSVKKTFDVLHAIASSANGMGVSEIARTINVAKSTVHNITTALEDIGVIGRDPVTKRYILGFALFELGNVANLQSDLNELVTPSMKELVEIAQEVVSVGVVKGEYLIVVDKVEPYSKTDIRIVVPRGQAVPLLAGATGKVLLSSMSDEKALEIIERNGLKKDTDHTITDPERYLEEVQRVREEGYATDYEEYIPGVRAIAAPITGLRYLESVLWVTGFRSTFDDEKMEMLKVEVKRTTDTISAHIREHYSRNNELMND